MSPNCRLSDQHTWTMHYEVQVFVRSHPTCQWVTPKYSEYVYYETAARAAGARRRNGERVRIMQFESRVVKEYSK